MYIYLHLPFCSAICSYCDFPKLLYDKRYISKYLTSLKQEILTRYHHEEVVSIYIGGGTPTSLDLEELTQLLELTKLFTKAPQIEFTIESNIESLTTEKINLLATYNINRISLGVQSFNNQTLKELNRKHTKEDVLRVIAELKAANFTNISIDYIYGVNSNLNNITNDLTTFLELDLPHISCYSLIIEEGTIFGINNRPYIDEELETTMYEQIKNTLTTHGYYQYEISNYAKPHYESRHNLNYWNNGEYYGFGLGAVSHLNHYRLTNTKNLTKYLTGNYQDSSIFEPLAVEISNEFILGLRKTSGINVELFEAKYHQDILTLYDIKDLLDQGYLILEAGYLKIPSKYLYLENDILLHFL